MISPALQVRARLFEMKSYKWNRAFSRAVRDAKKVHACYRESNPEVACLLAGICDSKGDGD